MSRGNAAVKAKRQQTILVARRPGAPGVAGGDPRAPGVRSGWTRPNRRSRRDVEELGLARVHDHDGLRYVVPGNGTVAGAAARL